MLCLNSLRHSVRRTCFSPSLLFPSAQLLSSSSSSSSIIQSELQDGVQTIRMTSPKTRNALSLEMMQEMRKLLAENLDQADLRCVVIRGDGPAFSSGHNLKELTSAEGRQHHQLVFRTCQDLMLDLVKSPVPVIAAVDGVAAAAGCQMVAVCDMAVATRHSTFSTPGANFGLFCSTPGVPVARAVPRKVSAYMLFTGNPIDADEALRSGLVSKLTSREDFEAELSSICDAIKSKPKEVIALGKRFFYRQLELGLSQALAEGGNVMVDNLALRDAQEGIQAFKEKRRPTWSHTEEKV